MDIITFLAQHSGELWAQIVVTIVALGGFLKGVEGLLGFIAPFTPWKWDDDIAVALGKLLANKIFQKKP